MRIDLGFSMIGDSGVRDQKYIHITRKDVLKRVNDHPAIDPWTKSFLSKRIAGYPDDALIFFVQNINQIVTTALEERSRNLLKEQHDSKDLDKDSIAGEVGVPGEFEQQSSGVGFKGIGENEGQISSEEDRESLFASRPSR